MLILRAPDRAIEEILFAPGGATLYTVQGHHGVYAWDLADHTGSQLLIDGRSVHGQFAIHPGGRWALGRRPNNGAGSEPYDSCLIDLAKSTYKPFNFQGIVGQHIAFSPNGKQLVTVGHSDYDTERPTKNRTDRLYGWKMTASGPHYEWHLDTPEDAWPWRVVFAGNDTLVGEDWIPTGPPVGEHQAHKPRLCVRNVNTGKHIRLIDSPTGWIDQLLASPDGNQVVVRHGTQMWIYDTADWQKPPVAVLGRTHDRHDGNAACFHPTLPYLFLANAGQSVFVFDTTTWKQVRKWTWKAGTLRVCATSPDDALAAAAGARGKIVVWDLDL